MSSMDEELLALRRLVEEMKQRGVEVEALDEFGDNLGTMRAGEFLALSEGDRPTDADAVGAFMSAEGEVFGDLTVNVGTVKQGQPAAGFNTDGDFFWAGASGRADENGLHLDGIRYALEHTATDTAGNNPRRGAIEMYYPDGEIAPAYRLIFTDAGTATELVTNGDFETGDMTGWTTSGSAYVGGISGNYYLGLVSSDTATSAAFAVSAGSPYLVKAKVQVWPFIRVDWYNSGGTLISSTTVANGYYYPSWANISSGVTAPAGATTAKIRLGNVSTAKYDDISVQARSVLTDLVFADNGIRGLWPEHHWCGWDAAQAFASNGTRKTMTRSVSSSQYCGYVSWVTTVVSADGDYYILRVPLAAGTYTFELCSYKFTGCGKGDLYVDGVKVSGATPFDFYAAAADSNSFWTVSSITVAKNGVHEFKVVVNGKNASSSYYRVGASYVCIKRTG